MRSGSYVKAMGDVEDSEDSEGSPKPSPKSAARRHSYLKATQHSLSEQQPPPPTRKWVPHYYVWHSEFMTSSLMLIFNKRCVCKIYVYIRFNKAGNVFKSAGNIFLLGSEVVQQVAVSNCLNVSQVLLKGSCFDLLFDACWWEGKRNGMQVSSVFGSKAVGDKMLPCVSPLHPHGQASLLRSHAGGLSVVATTECMLYAASEVSAILRKASVALHPHSHAPFPNTTLHRSTFPPPPYVPSLTVQVPWVVC